MLNRLRQGQFQHACSDAPDHKDFDPKVTALQAYEDSDYQPLYFVAENIQDALVKLRYGVLIIKYS